MTTWIHHMALLGILYAGSAGMQAFTPQQDYLRLLQEREQLSRNVRVVEQEIRLSKGKHLYLVVDLQSKQILLKMRGIALKRIPVFGVRKVGTSDCSTRTVILEESDSQITPRILPPGRPDAVDIVDVSDMPQAYKFGSRSGDDSSVALSVRPVPATLLARTWLHVVDAYQSGSYAVMRVLGPRHPSYRLLLSPEHAQSLYWAVEKGTPAILICD